MYWFTSTCLPLSPSHPARIRSSLPAVHGAAHTTAEPIRHALVARVRQEIAAGVYDTPEKWEAALDNLFDTLS